MKKKPISSWRGPTVAAIAQEAGLGTATVDRVLNARNNVRGPTVQKVLAAIERLKGETSGKQHVKQHIAFISDSGVSFNKTLEDNFKCRNNLP